MAIEQKYKWQMIFVTVLLVGVGLLCFFLGRSTIKQPKPEVIVEYVQGSTIHDTIKYPQPYSVERPIDTLGIIQQCIRDGIYTELFPTKVITQYIEVTREDTTGIMKDWATTRQYSETLFDVDTLGKCDINAEVQYNRLKYLSYDYTPVIKTVTITETKVKFFSPFIGAGVALNPWRTQVMDPMAGFSGGFFIKEKYGLQLQYNHAFYNKNDFLGVNLLYKF